MCLGFEDGGVFWAGVFLVSFVMDWEGYPNGEFGFCWSALCIDVTM